jgi:hypothetical protein
MPLAQRHAKLSPREVGTEAPVHASTKADVRVDVAVEPNLERVGEALGIDVGSADADLYEISFANGASEELRVRSAESHDPRNG